MKREDIAELFRRLRDLDPNPTTELQYGSPFELLVAVILSAQATDVGVNKATRRLFPVANTPKKILALGEEGLKRYISTIGLYNAKTRNIIATCALLLERHGGEVPRTREELEALPGVGRKTANVVLGNAYDKNEGVVVDTHVGRVSGRLGLTKQTDPVKIEHDLMKLFPSDRWTMLAHLLIEHGRTICEARRPKCEECFLNDICPSSLV